MAKTKLNVIKPSLGVLGLTDADLLQRLNAVHDGMSNNAAYPNPPVDMPGFKAEIDSLSAAVSAAELACPRNATNWRDATAR